MCSLISEWVDRNASKIFLAIIALAIIARLFSIAVMPVEAYNDSIFHIMRSREVIEAQTLDIPAEVPPPYYYIFASTFTLPLTEPFVRLIPLIFTAALLLVSLVLMRELFPENRLLQLAGFSFIAANSLLIRFGSVNYTGPIAAVFVLAALYFLARLKRTSSVSCLIALTALIASFSFTKLNATILFPAFALATAAVMYRKRFSLKKILPFILILFALSSLWFFANFFKLGTFFQFSETQVSSLVGGTSGFGLELQELFYVWDFPPFDSLAGIPIVKSIPLVFLLAAFGLMVAPLAIAILKGFWQQLKSKNLVHLTTLACFVLATLLWLMPARDYRILVPVVPLAGISLAAGLDSIKSKKARSAVIASLFLFALFSFAYNMASPIYYQSVYEKHSGMYSFIEGLPQNKNIFTMVKVRAIRFYTGKEAGMLLTLNNERITSLDDAEAVALALRETGYTHLAIGCHKSPWKGEVLQEMQDSGDIRLVYEDNCARVFKVSCAKVVA